MVIVSIVIIHNKEEKMEDHVKRNLKNAGEFYLIIKELREKRQEVFANKITESKLKAFLITLENFRGRLEKIQKETYSKIPGKSEEDIKERGELIDTIDPGFLDEFLNFLAEEFEYQSGSRIWEPKTKQNFILVEKENLRRCASIGVDQCFFDYNYRSLIEVLREITRKEGELPGDIVLVSDDIGIGLANSINPKWSNKGDFADRYPVVGVTKEKGIMKDVIFFEDNQKYYFIISKSIVNSNGRYLGNVIVGDEIGDNLVRKEKPGANIETTYLKGDKLIYSTRADYDSPSFISASFPLKDYYGERDLKVVLSANIKEKLEFFEGVKSSIFLLGFIVLIFGIAIIQILIRDFYRPFEVIDSGIHEIISGNFDHEFEFNFKEDLPRTIGEALNLMKLVLLGKPFPEEEEEKGEEWAKSLLIEEETIESPASEISIQEQPSPSETPAYEKIPSKEILQESADVYYRRVYNEYIEAKESVGEDVEKISYLKFVEKLVKNEAKLKKKFNCRAVRFFVKIKEGNVVLAPIPIYEKVSEETESEEIV